MKKTTKNKKLYTYLHTYYNYGFPTERKRQISGTKQRAEPATARGGGHTLIILDDGCSWRQVQLEANRCLVFSPSWGQGRGYG
jgi:hypothetical protein